MVERKQFTTRRPRALVPASRPASKAAVPSYVPKALAKMPGCVRYIVLMKCYLDKLPAAAGQPAKRAWEVTIKAWSKMPRAGLDKACTQATDALRRAASVSPRIGTVMGPCLKTLGKP